MKESFQSLKERVIDRGLCTSCGACKGICPRNVIDFVERESVCSPVLIGECIQCGMCSSTCVAAGMDFNPLLSKQAEYYGKKQNDVDHSYYLCHATDRLIWQQGASGGFVTAALIYALDKKKIKYAAVITNDPDKPWLPKVVLAQSYKEVVEAAQSKYCVIPTLEILQEIKTITEPIAMVMLPCQAQAFMNIRMLYPKMFQNVVFTVGLMCGNSLPFEATRDVLNHIGIKDITQITDLKYRDGFWHGELHVRLKDETEKGIPVGKYMRYMADFYRKDRCKVCVDGDAIFTDISSGDGWIPNKKLDNVYGWSIIHTHTKIGEQIVQGMLDSGVLYAHLLTEKEAFKQKHLYHRHYSSLPRIENRRRKGIPVPSYTGLHTPPLIMSNRGLFKKRVIDFCQNLIFSQFTRKMISPLSIEFKTGFLEFVMKLWFREK